MWLFNRWSFATVLYSLFSLFSRYSCKCTTISYVLNIIFCSYIIAVGLEIFIMAKVLLCLFLVCINTHLWLHLTLSTMALIASVYTFVVRSAAIAGWITVSLLIYIKKTVLSQHQTPLILWCTKSYFVLRDHSLLNMLKLFEFKRLSLIKVLKDFCPIRFCQEHPTVHWNYNSSKSAFLSSAC